MTSSKQLTWRKVAVYLSASVLLALADPRPLTFAAGCLLVASAWMLRIWAFGHLEKNALLVTSGPYAHTRNPAYLGSFLALVGLALAAGNGETAQGRLVWGISLALIIGFFILYLPRKFDREYGRLGKIFGREFLDHAANVPDFWPRLRPWRSGAQRRFSARLVGENHEWPWGLVLTGLMGLVWLAPHWSPFYGLLG